jgi:hypothetical protein
MPTRPKARGKKIHVELPESTHRKLRVKAALEDISIQGFVADLIARSVSNVVITGEQPASTAQPDAVAEPSAQYAVDLFGRSKPAIAVQRRTSIRSRTAERDALHERYSAALVVNPDLSRSLVSFQSNKTTPFYRWFKFKEAFSHEFVRHILHRFPCGETGAGRILDPFAGAGTTLTTATKEGWHATGIELLPVGTAAMKARLLADTVDPAAFEHELKRIAKLGLRKRAGATYRFRHLRITASAFAPDTEDAISAFMQFHEGIAEPDVRYLFWFAALSVLEDVSYTRKDGQYLRWDSRSERVLRSNFSKGPIPDFRTALLSKLRLMQADIAQRNGGTFSNNVDIINGSCLEQLPALQDASFDLMLTSPPYCNRYDYTRTYALELAFMGYGEKDVTNLRQQLLSATVENKTKREVLSALFRECGREAEYRDCESAFDSQRALQEVLEILRDARDARELNNTSIPGMVEHYFFEMNLVIKQLSRVLAPGGRVVMVNDNVQYHGEEVPVDLILSDFAASAGLTVESIWVLSKGKGNSSQQMGAHGRRELRKCVYVWYKPSKQAG